MDSQVFSAQAFSLNVSDLIPADEADEDDGIDEMDARQLRQARHRRAIDLEDVLECAWAHFRERPEVLAFVEDAVDTPYDPDRIRVHPMDALRVASAFAAEIQAALDDQISMLDAVED
jgi:hypothetical protein